MPSASIGSPRVAGIRPGSTTGSDAEDEDLRRLLDRAVLDVHFATIKPHDTKMGWYVLRRNTERKSTITAEKGYDWANLRSMLRSHNVRPVSKHREFDSLDRAHNVRLDANFSRRRSVLETILRVLKQRYGDRLRSQSWYRQFREFTLKCAVKNIDDSLAMLLSDFEHFNMTDKG